MQRRAAYPSLTRRAMKVNFYLPLALVAARPRCGRQVTNSQIPKSEKTQRENRESLHEIRYFLFRHWVYWVFRHSCFT